MKEWLSNVLWQSQKRKHHCSAFPLIYRLSLPRPTSLPTHIFKYCYKPAITYWIVEYKKMKTFLLLTSIIPHPFNLLFQVNHNIDKLDFIFLNTLKYYFKSFKQITTEVTNNSLYKCFGALIYLSLSHTHRSQARIAYVYIGKG